MRSPYDAVTFEGERDVCSVNERKNARMSQILDRRNALKLGLLATAGVGTLSLRAEASTDLQSQNEAVVGRWFTEFWGRTYNPAVVDELAAPDMLLKYSLHKPRHGRENIKAFMERFSCVVSRSKFLGNSGSVSRRGPCDWTVGRWWHT